MWHQETKFETASYPIGGVAPSTHVLALHTYIQKIRAQRRR